MTCLALLKPELSYEECYHAVTGFKAGEVIQANHFFKGKGGPSFLSDLQSYKTLLRPIGCMQIHTTIPASLKTFLTTSEKGSYLFAYKSTLLSPSSSLYS
jgi:hypothetical protein